MSGPEPDFDVIIVGAGVAGCVTAYELAGRGLSVALIERGETPGSKNLSGGVLYCRAMQEVFPDFLTEAPVERIIDRNRVCFLNPTSWVGLDYGDERLHQAGTAVTVLRAHLDAWLAGQCEDAGVMVMPGVRVDALLVEDGAVRGVRAEDDVLRARVVVAADGVNSFLARDAGLRDRPPQRHLAVGVKALVRLPRETLEERFGVAGDHGVAMALVGDCTQGIGGGGFLYTNRDSVSVGVVLRLDDLTGKRATAADVFDHLLDHPFVAPLLAGGELVEYGSHLVAEGGEEMRGRLVHDGLVIVGDAAGLTINSGLTVRGMDLAVGSARAAADGIAAALAEDDTSAAGLAGYERALADSFVGRDLRTYARAPRFLENERLYGAYGTLAADVLHDVFHLDATPRRHLLPTARAALRGSGLGLGRLARDAWQGVRAL